MTEFVWNNFNTELPEIGKRFIALYNDGSGAKLFFRSIKGYLDAEGDKNYPDDFLDDYWYWAYLPNNFKFFCEERSEEPCNFD